MKIDYDSYVCEYSPRSGNFHITGGATTSDMLET